jgi:hypothetical protein
MCNTCGCGMAEETPSEKTEEHKEAEHQEHEEHRDHDGAEEK